MKRYDLGRVYARKCINLARILGHFVWATNASMMICKAFVQQSRKNEAKNELQRTKQYAAHVGTPQVIEYINKVCL